MMHTEEAFFTFSVWFRGDACTLEGQSCPLGGLTTDWLNADRGEYLSCAKALEAAFQRRDRMGYRTASRRANALLREMPLYGLLAKRKDIDPPPFQSHGEGFFANREGYLALAQDLRWLEETVVPFLTGERADFPQPAVLPQVWVRYVRTDGGALEEEVTFQRLSHLIVLELGKALTYGSSPKRCRNCGRWFLKERGTGFEYCAGPAPGEEGKTCREVGARTSFGHKVKDNEVWKLHQRAYKKYYARVLKKTMSREEFQAWTREAERLRDAALEEYAQALAAGRTWPAEEYQAALNRL